MADYEAWMRAEVAEREYERETWAQNARTMVDLWRERADRLEREIERREDA